MNSNGGGIKEYPFAIQIVDSIFWFILKLKKKIGEDTRLTSGDVRREYMEKEVCRLLISKLFKIKVLKAIILGIWALWSLSQLLNLVLVAKSAISCMS